MDEMVPQMMNHQGSLIPAMNLLPCFVSAELALPLEVPSLQLADQCSVAEERDRHQIGR